MSCVLNDAGARRSGRAVLRRASIVLRGAGYGCVAGLVSGAAIGVLLSVSDPAWWSLAVLYGGGLGGMAGLAAGLIGGVAFALGMPCLERCPHAVRPAGAAVLPGTIVLVWCALFIWWSDIANDLLLQAEARVWLAGIGTIGAVAGALVAPCVLHGKCPGAARRNEGADSLR